MKKIIALFACVSLVSAGTALAAALATGNVTATDGLSIFGGTDAANAAGTSSTLIGKTSTGVKAGFAYATAGYAVNTKHSSGSTAYGTANDATAIYKSEIGTTTALTAPTLSSAGVYYSAFTTWTSM